MNRKLIWVTISFLIVLSMVLLSCTTKTTTTSTSSTPAKTTATSSTAAPPATKTTTSAPATTSAPPAANWWDKYGEPQYGGTITYRLGSLSPNFDNSTWYFNELNFWWDAMFVRVNWTTDRNTWAFTTDFTPEEYCTGILAESWEVQDLQTIIINIRQGVHFQDKPPVNGRELTAYDVQEHYDKILGTGSGYTEPEAMYGMFTSNYDKVTATDKYTVVYKFKDPSAFNLMAIIEPLSHNAVEPPEWVKQGDTTNWKNAVGSGPWMLTDFVDGTSMTYSRNPNYWDRDERYPQNQVPYADTLKLMNIPDMATAISALRTGKIDILSGLDWRQGQALEGTNPDMQIGEVPGGGAGLQFRSDMEPYTDINVRKALQMSIDRKSMAENLFGGTVDGTPIGMVNPVLKGYCYAYEDWPQTLKDEYGYNPERAKQLLADAGYPDGFKTNIVTSTGGSMEVLEAIKAYFMDIGVDMEIRTMDWAQYGEFCTLGKHDQMSTQGSGATWPPNRLIQAYDSRNRENAAHNNSPEYDALVDQFWAASDAAEIARLTREMDKLSIEMHWSVNTFATVGYTGWQPWLKGYSGETHTAWGGGYLFARLWVDEALKK